MPPGWSVSSSTVKEPCSGFSFIASPHSRVMISWVASARRTVSSPGVVTASSRRWCAGRSVVIRGRQAVPLVDAGEDGFLEDVERAESGVPVKLEGRTGMNTFSPSFACLGIRAVSSSVW